MDLNTLELIARYRSEDVREYDSIVDGRGEISVYHVQVGVGSLEDTLTLEFRSCSPLSDDNLAGLMRELAAAAGVLVAPRLFGARGVVPLSAVEVTPAGETRVRFPLPPDGEELEEETGGEADAL